MKTKQRTKDDRKWKIVFPRQGNWYYVTLIIEVRTIYDYLKDNYKSVRIEVISFSGDSGRKWNFPVMSSVNMFYAYMKSTFGQGNFKLRMRVTKRHHHKTK